VPAAVRQITAVVAIGAIGSTALAASGSGAVSAVASKSVSVVSSPSSHRVVEGGPVGAAMPPAGPAKTKQAAPAAKPAAHRPASTVAAKPKRVGRWIPSGTGMWIYEWKKSNGGNAAHVVSRARSAGLTHLFVRTGSTHDHYTGAGVLRQLLPATAHTNIKVIAWDFPQLKNPRKDALRLAYAAYAEQSAHVPHVAAVAPDIETRAEGTRDTAARITLYLTTLRRLLPRNVAILTAVPWPSSARVGRYPYATVAAHSDVLQ